MLISVTICALKRATYYPHSNGRILQRFKSGSRSTPPIPHPSSTTSAPNSAALVDESISESSSAFERSDPLIAVSASVQLVTPEQTATKPLDEPTANPKSAKGKKGMASGSGGKGEGEGERQDNSQAADHGMSVPDATDHGNIAGDADRDSLSISMGSCGGGGGSFGGGDFGGCFSSECEAAMADGTTKRVADITKGDLVRTCFSPGATAQVQCVIVVRVPQGYCGMVKFPSGLVISPGHPVYLSGDDRSAWVYPRNVHPTSTVETPYVYNFLLSSPHPNTIVVNDMICFTLGHPIGRPSFYGNYDRIIASLKAVSESAFEMGRVEVAGVTRDGNGHASGFKNVDKKAIVISGTNN